MRGSGGLRTAALWLAMGAALLAASCSGGGSKRSATASPALGATTATTAAATETPFPTPTVDTREPPGGLPPANYPPPRPQPSAEDRGTLSTDPLVVYADEVAASDFNGRRWPVIEVVSFNLKTHRISGLFRVGAVGEYAYVSQVELAGRQAVVNVERRVVVANLDGGGMRTLFQPPDGAITTTLAVSPDGRTAAIGTESKDLSPGPLAALYFVDVASGAEVRRIASDAFTRAGLYGTPGVLRWVDNQRAEVFGILHKGGLGPRPTAVVDLDGRIEQVLPPSSAVSPGGRYSATPSEATVGACTGDWRLPRSIAIRDQSSSSLAGELASDGLVASFNRWSPDGGSLLFSWYVVQPVDRPGSQCFDSDGPGRWETWSPSGVSDVPDLRALLRSWYGSRFIDLECEGKPIELPYPLNPEYLVCENSAATPPATLLVGGERVGVVHEAAIAGFIGP